MQSEPRSDPASHFHSGDRTATVRIGTSPELMLMHTGRLQLPNTIKPSCLRRARWMGIVLGNCRRQDELSLTNMLDGDSIGQQAAGRVVCDEHAGWGCQFLHQLRLVYINACAIAKASCSSMLKLTSTFRHFLCLLTSFCLPLYFQSQAEDLKGIFRTEASVGDSLIRLQPCWVTYVERRCQEWTNAASIAVAILGMSPSLLQMPGTNGDPLTRSLVYLFIFRMIAVIPTAVILVYYFRKDRSRSEDFAIKWFENARKNRDSYLYMPWTILALPFLLFSWGIVFLILALFASVWRSGLYPVPSADTSIEVHYPTIVLIRIIVTLMSVIDFGCIAWLVVTLKRWQGSENRLDPD